MAIDFVVLGMDSVLFDTEAAHFSACNRAFKQCGISHQWSLEQYRTAALAHGAAAVTDSVTMQLGAAIDKAEAAALSAEKNRIFHELACRGRMTLHAGCASLINEALDDGCKLAIVTDMSAQTAAVLLEQAFNEKLTGMFAAVATAANLVSSTDNSAYHLVLRTVSADPSRSVAIESSATGLLAAQRAGLWTLATTPLSGNLDSVAGAESWHPDLRAPKNTMGKTSSGNGKSSRFISLDALDTLKNASRINPSFASSAAAAWA